jgi:hypothetical protein
MLENHIRYNEVDKILLERRHVATLYINQLLDVGYPQTTANAYGDILAAHAYTFSSFFGESPSQYLKLRFAGFTEGAGLHLVDSETKSVNSTGIKNADDLRILYQYAGERSAMSAPVRANLARAVELETSGTENEAIRQKTGWFKGMDGKWRYEISDGAVLQSGIDKLAEQQRNDNNLYISLSELYDNELLYQAYPVLKNGLLVKVNDAALTERQGSYKDGVITISANSLNRNDKGIGILIHEIQHAIQDIEGFARGGNPQQFNYSFGEVDRTEARAALDAFVAANPKYKKALDLRRSLRKADGSLSGDARDSAMLTLKKSVADLRKGDAEKYARFNALWEEEIDTVSISETPEEQYRRLAGEIEARDAASRSVLIPEARAEFAPDLRPDAIVLFGDTPVASMPLRNPQYAEQQAKFDALSSSVVDSKSIATLRGGEGFMKRAAAWISELGLFGQYQNDDTGMSNIFFDAKSVERVIAHYAKDEKVALLQIVPEMIQKGIYLETIGINTSLKSHVFAAKAIVNGTPYVIGFVIRQDVSGRCYYDHSLTEIPRLDETADVEDGRGQDAETRVATSSLPPQQDGVRQIKRESVSRTVRKHLGVNPDFSEGGQTYFQQVFHGGPTKGIDRMSLDFVGTGEGYQSYGHGLYLAEERDTAEDYRISVSSRHGVIPNVVLPNGERISFASPALERKLEETGINERYPETAATIAWAINNGSKTLRAAENLLSFEASRLERDGRLEDAQRYGDARNALYELERNGLKEAEIGQLYKVEIPDNDVLLDYDKPLSEQPEKVREAIYNAGLVEPGVSFDGGELYQHLAKMRGQRAASEYLNSLGIPGLRYLDGNSRSKGEGTHNFVIWDDAAIEILGTYYQGKEGKRGPVIRGSIGPAGPRDPRYLINLFKMRDASTPIHELAHLFLSNLQEAVSYGIAPEHVREMWSSLQAAYDFEGIDLSREHHERFAREFEWYCREGHAPTPVLETVFQNFARWLTELYTHVRQLLREDEIDPRVRYVFDRLLAAETDEVIRVDSESAVMKCSESKKSRMH